MATRLGVGVIGTGTIAQWHIRALQSSPHGQVTAVFDVLTDRAQATAREFGIPTVAASVDELVARPDVDAVIVATPPAVHAAQTIQALEAGKHVLCEKPFALDPAEAARMVATADRTGLFLSCASARTRYAPAYQRAHAMIERGELGHIYHARSSVWRFRGRPGHHILPQSDWFLDRARSGGGVMMDLAVYTIDTVLWLLGNPAVETVTAQMQQLTEEPLPPNVVHDVEDHVVIMLQCAGNRSAIIESAWLANMGPSGGLFLFGTKAGLRFDPLRKFSARSVDLADAQVLAGGARERFHLVEERGFQSEMPTGMALGEVAAKFVEGIVAGHQPMTPGRDALVVTQVIEAAYRSARTQRAVALSAVQ